jgi:hypothetical protein
MTSRTCRWGTPCWLSGVEHALGISIGIAIISKLCSTNWLVLVVGPASTRDAIASRVAAIPPAGLDNFLLGNELSRVTGVVDAVELLVLSPLGAMGNVRIGPSIAPSIPGSC